MKNHALLISAALVVASGVAAIVVGCGSDSGPVLAGPNTTADGGDQVPTGGDPDSGSTSTGTNPDDAGTVFNPTPDASTGTPAGPGKVACGSTECDTATDSCCAKTSFGDGGLTTETVCQPKADQCNNGIGGSFACDEAADCAGGEVCCRGFTGASCKAGACGFGTVQVCSGAAECTNDGGACNEYTCKIAKTEYKIMACSKPTGCN